MPPKSLPKPKLILAILGPTAAGKSDLAVEIAQKIQGEILCLDSTTLYKKFDIGSSKPTEAQRAKVPHHMVDVLEPEEEFSANHFARLAYPVLEDIYSRAKLPILVGGTYFYLRALQYGMFPVPEIPSHIARDITSRFKAQPEKLHGELKKVDPAGAAALHPNDHYRIARALAIFEATGKKISQLKPKPLWPDLNLIWLKYALVTPRVRLSERIQARAKAMLEAGWLEEVRNLKKNHPQAKALGSVGYAQVRDYLDGKIKHDKLITAIEEATRQLAKKQLTWLRSDPELRFIDTMDADRVEKEVENLTAVLKETP